MNPHNENSMRVLVATHKKYQMPNDHLYLPIHVGKKGKQDIGYIGDDTGDNISIKNKNYCELTALYWAWKNLECEIIGLSHYRRYFSNTQLHSKATEKLSIDERFSFTMDEKTIRENIKSDHDIILPRKRNYYIETIWSHYKHAHNINDLQLTKDIIQVYYPDYIEAFNKVMNQKKLHLFNMFIMRKTQFDKYCKWLFNILGKLEAEINIENYTPYQARVFGFISERLFNVWVYKNNLSITEFDVVTMENEKKITKYYNFLKRKMFGIGIEV